MSPERPPLCEGAPAERVGERTQPGVQEWQALSLRLRCRADTSLCEGGRKD